MKKGLLLLFIFCATLLNAQNHKPTAQPDFYVGLEELPIFLFPLSNDTDQDSLDNLSWTDVTGPFNGVLDTIFGQTVYRGNVDFYGADFIFYKVCDDGTPVKCAYSTIFINVTNVNDPPNAYNDTFSVNEDASITMNVLQNDKDPDQDPLSVSAITTQPQHGTAAIVSNKIKYTPDANYNGTDELRYRTCDTAGGFFPSCDQARVFIRIIPVNDPPVAGNDSISDDLSDSVSISVNLLANDTDLEKDSLHVAGIIPGTGLSDSAVFNIDSAGNLSIASAPCGIDTFFYIVCDYSKCDTAYVAINIKCPPVPPVDTTSETLFLPQGFSPDGDGINDVLVFKGIDSVKPVGLQVFNRYGDIVYENADYQNDWDGKGGRNKEALPDGTYFYVLTLKDGKQKPNYLVIQR
ncbi:MAG: Ig-like domain-containing protein [Chitinophagales bacterium]